MRPSTKTTWMTDPVIIVRNAKKSRIDLPFPTSELFWFARMIRPAVAPFLTESAQMFREIANDFKLTATRVALRESCEHGDDTVDLVLGRRRRERQRERALERAVGSRERPLRGVRVEPVERPGADLRLDPLLAQPGQRLVAPVELDDVGLPAVPVPFGRARSEEQRLEPLRVPAGDALPRREQLLEPGELRDPDRAEQVRDPVVEARRRACRRASPSRGGESAAPPRRVPPRPSSRRHPRRSSRSSAGGRKGRRRRRARRTESRDSGRPTRRPRPRGARPPAAPTSAAPPTRPGDRRGGRP